MITVAFFDTKPYDREYFDRAIAGRGIRIRYLPVRLEEQTVTLAIGCQAVCAFVNDELDATVVNALDSLGIRLVAMRCAGYNNVDLNAALGKMHVVRVPAYSPYAVAEFAVALLLSLNRKTHKAYFRTRDGNFTLNGLCGFDLHGKTAGIVGTGKIGKVLAGILKGFGMEILVHDPFPDAAWAAASGARYVPVEELFKASDVVSLHCPLTPQTKYIVNRDTLKLMKPGALLINTGRGGLIDSRALLEALKTKQIGGAGLDVYEEEGDYFFEDHSLVAIRDDVLARLMTFPNVLLTSHQAFFTEEAMAAIAETTVGNICAYFDKGELQNEVCARCGTVPPPKTT